jgi:hypothetical protein
MTETSESAGVVIVPTTGVADAAHFFEQMIRCRKHFQPHGMYTDTWPHNKDFWEMMFGDTIQGRLGLFHLVKRLTENLKLDSPKFWQCKKALEKVLYEYVGDQENKLIWALKNGYFNGKRYTSDEIEKMKHSKVYLQRYGKFLPKAPRLYDVLSQGIDEWYSQFKDDFDKGLATCSKDVLKNIQNQKPHLSHIQDIDGIVMYREVPPGPRSGSEQGHGLSTYISKRPESHLEASHGPLAHYGNTGMGTKLAEVLTLRGLAHRNVKIRHKLTLRSEKSSEKTTTTRKVPYHLREEPAHPNHSMLSYLNNQAIEKGMKPPFNDVRPLPEDNGEVFLSEYYFQQLKRNETRNQLLASLPTTVPRLDPARKRCMCNECYNNDYPLPHELNICDENNPEQEVRETSRTNTRTGEVTTITVVATKTYLTVQNDRVIRPVLPLPTVPMALPPLLTVPTLPPSRELPPAWTWPPPPPQQWHSILHPPPPPPPPMPYQTLLPVNPFRTPATGIGICVCLKRTNYECRVAAASGKKPPGRVPHDDDCHMKIRTPMKRRKTKRNTQDT